MGPSLEWNMVTKRLLGFYMIVRNYKLRIKRMKMRTRKMAVMTLPKNQMNRGHVKAGHTPVITAQGTLGGRGLGQPHRLKLQKVLEPRGIYDRDQGRQEKVDIAVIKNHPMTKKGMKMQAVIDDEVKTTMVQGTRVPTTTHRPKGITIGKRIMVGRIRSPRACRNRALWKRTL